MTLVRCLSHPLALDKVGRLRNRGTSTSAFRRLVYELSLLLAVECTDDLEVVSYEIETPIARAQVARALNSVVLVPVLRAGLGMVEGMLQLLQDATVGHVGFYRDEQTLLPVEYYVNLPPDVQNSVVFVLDPMLATGGTASAVLTLLRERGVSQLRLVSLIAAPEGIARVVADHPDVPIYTVAVDDGLNEQGYIVPGLGDAGDRIFGTM